MLCPSVLLTHFGWKIIVESLFAVFVPVNANTFVFDILATENLSKMRDC